MKVVVIGGTGLIGSKLVERLRVTGHEALAASPDTGVDTLTGEGLADALEDARVVVDVANAPLWDDAAVLDFFQTSTRNLLAAETAAGVEHHVALSIVGADRLSASGYFRAKVAQEQAIEAGGVPYTILRATQFFRTRRHCGERAAVRDRRARGTRAVPPRRARAPRPPSQRRPPAGDGGRPRALLRRRARRALAHPGQQPTHHHHVLRGLARPGGEQRMTPVEKHVTGR
jgi:uncharacterized protein YbjT (DUF2867 family)